MFHLSSLKKFPMVFVVAALPFGYGAMAATDTVSLTATVLPVLTVAVSGGSPIFNVTPNQAITDQDIGTITINSNDPQGYTVSLKATDGVLKNTVGDESMAYTVKYDNGAALTLTATPQTVETAATTTSGEVTRTLTLTIAAAESLGKSAEAFSDTITVEILGQ